MRFFLRVADSFKSPNILMLVFLSVLFNILVLSNILQSDYFGDDLYNFQTPGKIPYDYITTSSYAYEAAIGWMGAGRFFPIAASYMYYMFDWFDTLYSYKVLLLTVVIISNLLFSFFIYLLSKNRHIALSILLITPILIQYRFYHDPILSFHGLMPLLFSFLAISLIFLLKNIQKSNKLYLIISLFFFAVCLLMYEISYTFILIYMLIISFKISIKNSTSLYFRVLSPYLFILILFTIFTLYLRSVASIDSGPYLPNWNVMAILKTYYLQTVSVLPTTYFISFGNKIQIPDFANSVLIIALPLFIFIYLSNFKLKKDKIQEYKYLVILAILIMLLPGLLISLSTKFQGGLGEMNKVQFGLAYIPIYIQTFGLSLLLSLIINKVLIIKYKFFILIGLIFILTIHLISNEQVIRKVNSPYKDNRELLTQFLLGDFKDKLHNGDTIKIAGEGPFHSKDFVSMITNKNIKVTTSDSTHYVYQIQYEINKNTAIIDIYDNNSKKSSIIIYEKINDLWKEKYSEFKKQASLEGIGLIPPIFNNFYPWEGEAGKFRWAKKDSTIFWINPGSTAKVQKLLFKIRSLNTRKLTINLNKNEVHGLNLEPNIIYVINKSINLQPGKNIIEFITEEPPVDPPGADDRNLLFSIEEMHPFYRKGE